MAPGKLNPGAAGAGARETVVKAAERDGPETIIACASSATADDLGGFEAQSRAEAEALVASLYLEVCGR